MTQTLIIPGRLPCLNDYIKEERIHRQRAAIMKHSDQASVAWEIQKQGLQPVSGPVRMRYLWVEQTRRRDKDNVSSYGRKVIQDALVQMGILQGDGWAHIVGFSDEFAVDAKNPRVEVEIVEV